MTTPAPRQRRGSVMGPARQSGGEQKLEREESLRRGSLSTQIEGIDAPVDRKGIEKAMYAYGLFLGKFWKIMLPIVICALAFMLSGWHKAKWSDMPMEKLWSTRGGYLESEWDYYEANEVKRWRKQFINVFATDQRDMGPETNTTGRAGDVLNEAFMEDWLAVHKLYDELEVTTKSGNVYKSNDLCMRIGGKDVPGPAMKSGKDWLTAGLSDTVLPGSLQTLTACAQLKAGDKAPANGLLNNVATLAGQDITSAGTFCPVQMNWFFSGAAANDQDRANSFFAFRTLRCNSLVTGDWTAFAEWEAPHVSLPDSTGLAMKKYSFNQIFGTKAPDPGGTSHLAVFGIGAAVMTMPDMCGALAFGDATFKIPNAIPGPKTPCLNVGILDCFQEGILTTDPVYRYFLDGLFPGRTMGKDFPSKFAATFGQLAPAGYHSKPSFRGKTPEQIKARTRTALNEVCQDGPLQIAADAYGLTYGSGGTACAIATTKIAAANCKATEVAVYQEPICNPTSHVDGCRARSMVNGFNVLPPNNATHPDPYLASAEYLARTKDYGCADPAVTALQAPKRGTCQAWGSLVEWPEEYIAGKASSKWSGAIDPATGHKPTIDRLPGALVTMFIDPPGAIAARRADLPEMQGYDQRAREAEVQEAIDLVSRKYAKKIDEVRLNFKAAFVSASTPSAIEDDQDHQKEDLVSANLPFMAIGTVCMLVLVVATHLRPGKPLWSRLNLMTDCFAIVLLTLASSMGFINWVGIEWTTIMPAILPILGMSIGIDDCFILVRFLDEIGTDAVVDRDADEIIARIVGSGGAAVTLTSFYLVGPHKQMHYVMKHNSEHFGTMPTLLVMKDIDYPTQSKDVLQLFAKMLELNDTAIPTDDKRFIRLPTATDFMLDFPKFIGAMSFGLMGPRNSEKYDDKGRANGAGPEGAGTPGCPLGGQIPDFFSPTLPIEAAPGFCMDIPNPFFCPNDMSWTHPQVAPFGTINATCFYQLFSLFRSPKWALTSLPVRPPPFDNTTTFGHTAVQFYPANPALGFDNPFGQLRDLMNMNRIKLKYNESGELSNPFYKDPTHMPICDDPNPLSKKRGCLYSFNEPWVVENPITMLIMDFNMEGVQGAFGSDTQVTMIKKVRKLIDESPLKDNVYPQSLVVTYADSNIVLADVTYRTLAINFGAITLIAMVLLQSIIGGLMAALGCALVLFQAWALLPAIGISFNMITSAWCLMAMGISIEFTAHPVACFMIEGATIPGREDRMKHVAKMVFPPVILGTLSTFFGQIGLAFRSEPFVVKYFFGAMSVLMLVGLFNAIVILPAFLMAFSCDDVMVNDLSVDLSVGH
eukprot:g3319.t1